LFSVREQVLLRLEELRKDKKIGKSLEARVRISADPEAMALLARYEGALKEVLNVSQVEFHPFKSPDEKVHWTQDHTHAISHQFGEPQVIHTLKVEVLDAEGHKCNRCWNYYPDSSDQHVRKFGPWDNVCGRCADALKQMGYNAEPQ